MNDKETQVSQSFELQSQSADTSLLEEYLQNLDSKTLKSMWKTKKVQEKMNKRQKSQIMRNRYKSEEEFIAAIEDALRTCNSLTHAAKILKITPYTLYKWGRTYFPDLMIAAKRRNIDYSAPRGIWWFKGKYPMREVLDGKWPNYPINRLRERLILHEVLPWKCAMCGFDEARLSEDKNNSSNRKHALKPILLDFIDGNPHNHLESNLRLLCYNCYFLLVGNVMGPHKTNHLRKMIKQARPSNNYTEEEVIEHRKIMEERLKKEKQEREKMDEIPTDTIQESIDATNTK